MKTADPTALYNIGCSLGTRDWQLPGVQDNIVVLDFGRPMTSGGAYGTKLFSGAFASTAQIASGVVEFAHGYYHCTSTDFDSHMRIAIGTSNYGPEVIAAHGRAWGQMVNTISQRVTAAGYSSQVDVAAGSDMEGSWNSAAVTRAWVDGYAAATTRLLYNYGAASGCPPYGSCATSAFPDWTVEDIWYISWGSPPAYPLPQIYLTSGANAQQWYRMSLYALQNHGQKMTFPGVLTQQTACNQAGCPDAVANTPETGWSQLDDALNADERTAQGPPRWSTDIGWQ
jgi:hypothetical protein